MPDSPTRHLSVCGLRELGDFADATHVLSILDPLTPEPVDFAAYGAHRRLTLRFHDIIEPRDGEEPPQRAHVEQLLEFGAGLAAEGDAPLRHLLVHCHAGVSRSTAAMATLLAEARPRMDADAVFAELRRIRPQAWPNSRMIGFADELLGRGGALTAALRRHYAEQIRVNPSLADMIAGVGRAAEVAMAG